MHVTLPFSNDELPEIVGGMLLTSIITAVQLFQLRVAVEHKEPNALNTFAIATPDQRREILIEGVKQVALMMPQAAGDRLRAQAEEIAAQILGQQIIFNMFSTPTSASESSP
jgi:hypothetical protein